MRRREAIKLIGASSMVLGVVGCGMFGGDGSFRVRMTVEADTPQGLKTGSSVMGMEANYSSNIGTQHSGNYSFGVRRGEAVVIDLANGPVFVLLKMPDASHDFNSVIANALNNGKRLTNDELGSFARKMGGYGAHSADLPKEDWPLMVRFRDIHDPKSIEQVDPAAVGIKRIWVETTRDPVTTGIEKRLGWLPAYFDRSLDGSRYETIEAVNRFANSLGAGDFSAGNGLSPYGDGR